MLLKVKYAFNLETQIYIYWDLNFTNHIIVLSLEVVYRGSETQLQVTEIEYFSVLEVNMPAASFLSQHVIITAVLSTCGMMYLCLLPCIVHSSSWQQVLTQRGRQAKPC